VTSVTGEGLTVTGSSSGRLVTNPVINNWRETLYCRSMLSPPTFTFLKVSVRGYIVFSLLAAVASTTCFSSAQDTAARSVPPKSQQSAIQQAEALEQQIKAAPDDADARARLLYFYSSAGFQYMSRAEAYRALRPHLLWFIEHQPGSQILLMLSPLVQPSSDPEGFADAKKLWLKQIDRYPDDPAVLENAGRFFAEADRKRAEQLLSRVLQLDPAQTMTAAFLAKLYRSDELVADSPEDRHALAGKALLVLENSVKSADGENRFDGLTQLAKVAFEANEMGKAESYAKEVLRLAPQYVRNWNYGNAIHDGNLVLGRIRLRQGKIAEAKDYLLIAGETPGSPQLNTYGPNMSLAKELLEKGERDVVLQYFELCGEFWRSGAEELQRWRDDVKANRTPDFGTTLYN